MCERNLGAMKAAYDPTKVNQVLSRLGVQMKKDRAGFWVDNSYGIRHAPPFRHGKPEAGLWFRTRGCGHDRIGGCVMCDYGAGPDSVTPDEMINSVRQGLETLPTNLYHLLVSPLGSFLDEWEVPKAARIGILQLMNNTYYESFSFESRAETINDWLVSECCSLLSFRPLKVYVGLESANPWISKYCINKALSLDVFEHGIRTLSDHDVQSVSNVILGTPFLSPNEQIQDAVQSVLWAFSRGTTECCLFPTHVKKWTSLVWLYQMGLYSPPSLWSYVEVLRLLGPDICSKIELSWYSTHKYQDPNLVFSPTTCDQCYETVIRYLDSFDETADFEFILKLVNFECSCKDLWRCELAVLQSDTILNRTINAYELIGSRLLHSWWDLNREEVLQRLTIEADAYSWIK